LVIRQNAWQVQSYRCDDGAEQRQERLPVDVVEEDLAMIRATVGDVVDPVWKLSSRLPRHAAKLRKVPAAR
jgi:hypothetical protein